MDQDWSSKLLEIKEENVLIQKKEKDLRKKTYAITVKKVDIGMNNLRN